MCCIPCLLKPSAESFWTENRPKLTIRKPTNVQWRKEKLRTPLYFYFLVSFSVSLHDWPYELPATTRSISTSICRSVNVEVFPGRRQRGSFEQVEGICEGIRWFAVAAKLRSSSVWVSVPRSSSWLSWSGIFFSFSVVWIVAPWIFAGCWLLRSKDARFSCVWRVFVQVLDKDLRG